MGVDARWEHCLLVVDAAGNITEQWTQYDSRWSRPHYVAINPYDAEKHVWLVDDQGHAVYEMTNDGKQIVQTLGTPNEPGADDKHFNRPTFLAWLPDGTLFVSDGYANTRVVKFDKDGKYLTAWGQKATPPNDTRPGYFDAVHGVVTDPDTRRVYVTDRSDHRIQVFDENGKFLDQFSTGNSLDAAVPVPRGRRPSVDRRQLHVENREVRSGRALPVFLGQPGPVARRDVESARAERGSAGQPVHGRSEQWPRTEVPSARRRQSGFSGWPAGARRVEIGEGGKAHPVRE